MLIIGILKDKQYAWVNEMIFFRNGTLDILIADTPILDYYRATDHGCKLQKIGDAINEDTYAVGMAKGFPLKVSSNMAQNLSFQNGHSSLYRTFAIMHLTWMNNVTVSRFLLGFGITTEKIPEINTRLLSDLPNLFKYTSNISQKQTFSSCQFRHYNFWTIDYKGIALTKYSSAIHHSLDPSTIITDWYNRYSNN